MTKCAYVKTVLRITGTVRMVHTLSGDGGTTGTTLMAYGQGDSIVISTSAKVSAAGDSLILGG